MRPSPTAALLVVLSAGGCGVYGLSDDPSDADPAPLPEAPELTAISRDQIRVGEALDFIGGGWIDEAEGHTEIEWLGTYYSDDGEDVPVHLSVRPHRASDARLVWQDFGPYGVPFMTRDDQVGYFLGTVRAINVIDRAARAASRPLEVHLEVLPSVIVRELHVAGATCGEPGRYLIGGFPLELELGTIGDRAARFAVEFVGDAGEAGAVQEIAADPDGRARLETVVHPVGDDHVFHVVELRIAAVSSLGESIEADYQIGVHRPIEYVDWQSPQLAEIEAPVAVSGCVRAGWDAPLTYLDAGDDRRSRQLGIHWDETFVDEVADPALVSRFGFTMSSVDGVPRFGWNPPGGVAGGATLAELAELGLRRLQDPGEGSGWTVGHDNTETDVESWAHRAGRPVDAYGDAFFELSSKDTLARQISAEVTPEHYGVWWRQATRIARPGGLLRIDMCGRPEIVADASFSDYAWAVEAAQSPECPPLPQPITLPPAECLIDCD